MIVILILLALSALYCAVNYAMAFMVGINLMRQMKGRSFPWPPEQQAMSNRIELYTFHLGLCFILSIGFLGLLLK